MDSYYTLLKITYKYAERVRDNLAAVTNDRKHYLFYDLGTHEIVYESEYLGYYHEVPFSLKHGIVAILNGRFLDSGITALLNENNKVIFKFNKKQNFICDVKRVDKYKMLILFKKHTKSPVEYIVAYDSEKQKITKILNCILRMYIDNGIMTIHYYENEEYNKIELKLYRGRKGE